MFNIDFINHMFHFCNVCLEIMKKFMILMLSLAVLFSFTACDNSGDTPATDEPSSGVTTEIANTAASTATTAINDTTGFTSLVAAGAQASKVGTALADITTLTITKTDTNAPSFGLEPATQTIVLSGINTSAATDNGTSGNEYDVTFNTFDYTYTAYGYDVNGEVITHTATISGHLAGSVKATVATDAATGLVSTYTLAGTPSYILDEANAISFTVGDVVYDADSFTNALNLDADGGAIATTYTKYANDQDTKYQAAIDGFVTALTGENGSDAGKVTLATVLATAITDKTEGMTISYTGTATSGSATITYKPTKDVVVANDGSSHILVLPAESTLTVTLASASNVQATDSFTAATYTLSGNFNVYTAYTDTETNTPNGDFTSISVTGLSGVAGGTVTGGTGDVVESIASVEFTTKTAGSASATCPVGPQLVSDGSGLVTDTVIKRYNTTV